MPVFAGVHWRLTGTGSCRRLPAFAEHCAYLQKTADICRSTVEIIAELIICAGICRRMDTYAGERGCRIELNFENQTQLFDGSRPQYFYNHEICSYEEAIYLSDHMVESSKSFNIFTRFGIDYDHMINYSSYNCYIHLSLLEFIHKDYPRTQKSCVLFYSLHSRRSIDSHSFPQCLDMHTSY